MRKIITMLIVALATLSSLAQNGTTTPYSRLGYGILGDNATSSQQAMGGVGYAMNSGRQINAMNPASYARIDSLTFLFDMGLDLSAVWRNETDKAGNRSSANDFGGGLSYITMQFPVSKRLGMSVGLLPFSSVGYAFGSEIDNGYSNRSGDGSINQLYLGASYRIVGGLSVGVNAAYLFGTTLNDNYVVAETPSETGSTLSTSLYQYDITVRDWRVTAGLQYTQPLGQNTLTFGAVYTPGKKLLGHYSVYKRDLSAETAVTEALRLKLADGYSLPDTYGVGLNLDLNRRWMVEADFTYQPWSKCKFDGAKDVFADRWRVGLGAQLQPSPRGSYLGRTLYRAGIFYDHDYLKVGSNGVREYGASVGLGLPVPNFKSVVNLSFGWLHRQAHPAALVKENYLNITVGVNFNEMWFRKARIY